MKSFLCATLALMAFGSGVAHGQSIPNQRGYWIRYYNQFTINSKWVWHNELDERRLLNPDRQAQIFFHTHLHYQFKPKFDVAAASI